MGRPCKTKVYTLQSGEWVLSDNEVTIPEGYYVVSPQWVETKGK